MGFEKFDAEQKKEIQSIEDEFIEQESKQGIEDIENFLKNNEKSLESKIRMMKMTEKRLLQAGTEKGKEEFIGDLFRLKEVKNIDNRVKEEAERIIENLEYSIENPGESKEKKIEEYANEGIKEFEEFLKEKGEPFGGEIGKIKAWAKSVLEGEIVDESIKERIIKNLEYKKENSESPAVREEAGKYLDKLNQVNSEK